MDTYGETLINSLPDETKRELRLERVSRDAASNRMQTRATLSSSANAV